MWPFLISSMVLGLLNQLHFFLQLYLIKLLRLLTGLGQLELYHLIYPRLLTGFRMLVFFTNLSLMGFQVRYLALFLLFSVIDGFGWFWMGSLHKNIQLMLEFPKGPFLVLHFSYYTLMTFLMMLSVILLSMPMIILSILNVIRHLICGNNLNWLLNLNLIYKTLWTEGRSGLLISMLGKLNWFRLTGLVTLVLLMLLSVILLLCWWYYSSFELWPGIWSVAITWIDFWTWIWSTTHCGLGQEVACWFQRWENSTGFVWVV